ncbi:hypothetical protein ES708_05558 [subsurface metagenome]
MSEPKFKVQIYEPNNIFTGYVACSGQERFLDVLNGSSLGAGMVSLPLSQVECSAVVTGEVVTAPLAYINKANILFVKDYSAGSQTGPYTGPKYLEPKLYPFIIKSPIAVRVSLPFYTLTGQMYCAKGKGVEDALDSGLRFFPMTNVEISPGGEPPASFVAVNKGQILYVEPVGEKEEKRVFSISGNNKGLWCPFKPITCEEGYCHQCQIYLDRLKQNG